MMSNYYNDSTERLFRAITNISTVEECRAFFEDLCTIKEIRDMEQRLNTAILLDKGYSYQKIADMVGISTATITRVNNALTYGSNGYKTAISKMTEAEKNDDDK